MTLTAEHDQSMQNIKVKDRSVQKLLPGHKDTHTRTIALPGPLKWSATTLVKTGTILRILFNTEDNTGTGQ